AQTGTAEKVSAASTGGAKTAVAVKSATGKTAAATLWNGKGLSLGLGLGLGAWGVVTAGLIGATVAYGYYRYNSVELLEGEMEGDEEVVIDRVDAEQSDKE
ncbi:MAG: hypothetical protein HN602_08260, partial [Gammaproteobacteria bacterium]|nr:hypothetical protein [Gammaproteobacteria bacterium]